MNQNIEPKVIKTDEGASDGQNKCPKCGSTDVSLNINNGHLRCEFCRHEFKPEKVNGLETDISKLQGQTLGSGAQDIVQDTNDILTFKCSSCGKSDKSSIELMPVTVDAIKYITLAPAKKIFLTSLSSFSKR